MLLLTVREPERGVELGGERYEIRYAPAESDSGLFGGNSNWRGPVWMPLNYLLIEALKRRHTGRGLGASHQTGWTALAANVLERVASGARLEPGDRAGR